MIWLLIVCTVPQEDQHNSRLFGYLQVPKSPIGKLWENENIIILDILTFFRPRYISELKQLNKKRKYKVRIKTCMFNRFYSVRVLLVL